MSARALLAASKERRAKKAMSDFRNVTGKRPCAICQCSDWCSYIEGEIDLCRRLDAGEGVYNTDSNGADYWLYFHDPDASRDTTRLPAPPPEPQAERADPDTLNAVYRALLDALPLTTSHKKSLRNRGLSDEAIQRRSYKSMTGSGRAAIARALSQRFGQTTLLKVPGFYVKQENSQSWMSFTGSEGICIPVRDQQGRVAGIQIRQDRKDGPKYVWLSSNQHGGPGSGAPAHVPLHSGDTNGRVRLTEGALKADIATELSGIPTIGMAGVSLITPAMHALKALDAREVSLSLDADARENYRVAKALQVAARRLVDAGYDFMLETWPAEAGKGIDDALASRFTPEVKQGPDAFMLLTDIIVEGSKTAPKPTPKAAATPVVEILDEAPPRLTRPLALIEGQSYAATWLYTKTTTSESYNGNGEVVKYEVPHVTEGHKLYIVRGDGKLFAPEDVISLGIEVRLPDVPHPDKLWRYAGVRAYEQGQRPEYADVFWRMASVYDHYIDFSCSFADQSTMCQLAACGSLATWLIDAFTLIGYLWFGGERGSGKSQCGICWANTSYLGTVLLSSGSFAALRDLADYGGAMLFDDAENLSDPRKSDPDKREMALAGNRRNTTIPLKEPSPDGRGWRIRYVNAYCPRAFTAINQPDPVLASRTIRIPLVRTADPTRANRDPADFARWPTDRMALQDDLWATALALLPEAQEIWAELDNETELLGREFEPWRPIITVARLFEQHGVEGLEGRMREAMRAYQREKADVDTTDRAVQVLRAIYYQETGIDPLDGSDNSDNLFMGVDEIKVEAGKLADKIKEIGALAEFNTDWVSANAVGWQLTALRFMKARNEKTKKRERFRKITVEAFKGLCVAYGLIRPYSQAVNKTSELSEVLVNRLAQEQSPQLEPVRTFFEGREKRPNIPEDEGTI